MDNYLENGPDFFMICSFRGVFLHTYYVDFSRKKSWNQMDRFQVQKMLKEVLKMHIYRLPRHFPTFFDSYDDTIKTITYTKKKLEKNCHSR